VNESILLLYVDQSSNRQQLVYKWLHGLTQLYLSDDCQLVTDVGRRLTTSQVFRRLHVCRPTDTVTDWRQEFLCSWTVAMEQPTDRDPEKRHYNWTLHCWLLLKCDGHKHSCSLTHSLTHI